MWSFADCLAISVVWGNLFKFKKLCEEEESCSKRGIMAIVQLCILLFDVKSYKSTYLYDKETNISFPNIHPFELNERISSVQKTLSPVSQGRQPF